MRAADKKTMFSRDVFRLLLALLAGEALACGGNGTMSKHSCDGTIEIADPVLDALVRAQLGAGAGQALSSLDLLELTELVQVPESDTARPVRSLKGLECATNLEVLSVTGRYLGDLKVDGVKDASPLSGLSKLRELTITNAELDLTTLSNLVELTRLKLDYATPGTLAKPGNLDALGSLVHLRELDVSDGCLEDISALAGMTELVELDLYSNCVSDIAPLSGLTRLEHLDLTDNFLDCTSPDTQAILDGLNSRGTVIANDCE